MTQLYTHTHTHTHTHIYMYVYILFHISFHSGLPQNIEYSYLFYTVWPCCLSLYISSFLSKYDACAFGTCLTIFFFSSQSSNSSKSAKTRHLNQSFRAFCFALTLWSKDQLSMGLSSLASSRATLSALPSEGASEDGGHDENTER